MDAIILILSLIFLILAWQFILEPILDGLGGFGRGLIDKLMEPDRSLCESCRRPLLAEAKFCHFCGREVKK